MASFKVIYLTNYVKLLFKNYLNHILIFQVWTWLLNQPSRSHSVHLMASHSLGGNSNRTRYSAKKTRTVRRVHSVAATTRAPCRQCACMVWRALMICATTVLSARPDAVLNRNAQIQFIATKSAARILTAGPPVVVAATDTVRRT